MVVRRGGPPLPCPDVSERVRITDVAPRDGLQNEPGWIPTAEKVRLVRALIAAGVDGIEVSSFVSRRWVPQLGDAAEVLGALLSPPHWDGLRRGCALCVLVPNEQGMRAALEVNRRAREQTGAPIIHKVAVFTAASETFSLRNTNATIAQTLDRFRPVIDLARAERLPVRGYVSCAVACPYEGPVSPARAADVAHALWTLGATELDVADTIGAAEPETITLLLNAVYNRLGDEIAPSLTLHLHDTFGRAAECVRTALSLDVRSFDGSAGGLGGCPFASVEGSRAPGNIATDALVRTVRDAGYEMGVDLAALDEASRIAEEIIGRARLSPKDGPRDEPAPREEG
jgi:hydroxymethylglutaryl-CoA lyase